MCFGCGGLYLFLTLLLSLLFVEELLLAAVLLALLHFLLLADHLGDHADPPLLARLGLGCLLLVARTRLRPRLLLLLRLVSLLRLRLNEGRAFLDLLRSIHLLISLFLTLLLVLIDILNFFFFGWLSILLLIHLLLLLAIFLNRLLLWRARSSLHII